MGGGGHVVVWEGVTEIVPEAVEKTGLNGSDIAAVGVTGQGDGNMVDKNGDPIQKAILRADGRRAISSTNGCATSGARFWPM